MRKKRILAFLLSLAMLMPTVSTLLPSAAAVAPTVPVAPAITYATNPTAFVKNLKLSQGSAWNLQMTADMQATGEVYAVIMKYSDYEAKYSSDSTIGTILPSNYNNLAGLTAGYYKSQKTTVSSAANGIAMFSQPLFNFSSTVGEASTTYHAKYALIVFDGATSVGALKDYTIGSFYVDSQGKLQTESYMLRYKQNAYPAGSTVDKVSMPAYQIEGWGTSADVKKTPQAQNPTRLGYTFYGWHSTDKVFDANANTAAGQNPTVDFKQDTADTTLTWATALAKFGGGGYNKDTDKIYDLFATWKPVQVKINALTKTAGAGTPEAEQTTKAKVGNTFLWEYESDGSWNDSTKTQTGGNTQKIITAQYQKDGETQKNGLPAGMGLATSKQDAIMTYAQLAVTPTNSNQKPKFYITGRPTEVSEKPITITLTIKDNSNNTTATITLKLTEIEKGSQALKPDEDVSTGLETDVVDQTVTVPPETEGGESTETTVRDGQILGLYSLGQKIPEAEGGHPNADGSGSLRDYYLTVGQGKWNEALIYEYRPHKEPVEGEADKPEEWREIPLPASYYDALTADSAPLDKAALQESLKLHGGTIPKRIASTYAVNTTPNVQLRDETPADTTDGEGASVPWTGWPENYGYIEWDTNGCPVIHGLTEGAKYDVRFKANNDYGASEVTTLTISKGGGGGTSGPADPSDFASIVFYDWDGTLLGSKVVGKNQSAVSQVEEFTNARIAKEDDLDSKYLWYSTEKIEADKAAGRVPKYLSNKKGYDFDTWLLNESDTFTAQDNELPTYGVDDDTDAAAIAAGVADFSNVTEDMIVKSSYKANATLNKTAFNADVKTWTGLDKRYSISEPIYDRYGAANTDSAGIYSLTVEVSRENEYGFGTTRLQKPAMRAVMNTDESLTQIAVTLNTLSYLEGCDLTNTEIVPPKAVKTVVYSVIDMATASNWPSYAAASKSITKSKNSGTIGSDGFVKFGTVALLNRLSIEAGHGNTANWLWVNAKAFQDAGLDISGTNLNTAKSRMQAYFAVHDTTYLDDTELQEVIDGIRLP